MNRLTQQFVLMLIAIGLAIPTAQSEALSEAQLYDIACNACHSLGSTPDHRVGPPLGNLLDRKAAAVEGYRYSDALRASELNLMAFSNVNLISAAAPVRILLARNSSNSKGDNSSSSTSSSSRGVRS